MNGIPLHLIPSFWQVEDSGQKTRIHMLPILPDQPKRKNHNDHINDVIYYNGLIKN